MRFIRFLVALCLSLPAPALAQALPKLPTASPSASASADAPEIAAQPAPDEDARLAARIRAIFDEIPALKGTGVRVAAGVVTLTGQVPDEKTIQQAEAIATRLNGVVTVQNRLERNLDVEKNLNPALSGVTGRINGFLRALPLLGVAIAVAVVVGMLGYALARQSRLWERVTPNPFLAGLVATAIRFVFVVAGIVLALDIVGATAMLGAVLGGAGVLGLAVGLAVRDSIDNYFSSLMLSVRQPFRANDNVKIDSHEGRVLRLTSRATLLLTPDGNHLRIPNATVFKAVITNFTTNPQRRFAFDYAIDHEADPCRAQAVALETLRNLDWVLDEPKPGAEIADISGSVQVLRFNGWIDQTRADFGKSRTRAMEAVRKALREAGFVAESPEYRIHLDHEPPQSSAPKSAGQATVDAEDVAPDHHMDRMVHAERGADVEGKDLLDSRRPTE
ncbi:mechanosensitive ion channel domain-containing protein [Novosphingobium jiangmenense]|uniref:Small-conductance mechanosensitive channel n=1 Tax=Novosphingobium jiangmenense TaxID=2791981 RepID=A0ABS0HGJ4_9SPHN|nr:mechanosensitive ion channel domain-containing protein [Novosphingobium jiangmenense]MBF9151273.1 mechanosensitive ion channel [Novosphingobium jiangmenense]